MKNKIAKVAVITLVIVFLSTLIVPSLIYANSQLLSNGEEVICSYVDFEGNYEENSFKTMDKSDADIFSKIGVCLLGVSFVTLVTKGAWDMRTK